MLYKIGVCDSCEHNIEKVNEFLCSADITFNLLQSTNSEHFLNIITTDRPDVIFLDIELELRESTSPGKQIKKMYPNTIIIYVTAFEIYVLKAFQERAFQYLIKPIEKEQFLEIFHEARTYIRREKTVELNNKFFTVKETGETISIPYKEILYFKKKNDRIYIQKKDGEKIEFSGDFTLLQQKIENDLFLRCHENFIVNTGKIRNCKNKNLILDNNKTIPLCRKVNRAMYG